MGYLAINRHEGVPDEHSLITFLTVALGGDINFRGSRSAVMSSKDISKQRKAPTQCTAVDLAFKDLVVDEHFISHLDSIVTPAASYLIYDPFYLLTKYAERELSAVWVTQACARASAQTMLFASAVKWHAKGYDSVITIIDENGESLVKSSEAIDHVRRFFDLNMRLAEHVKGS